MSTPPARSISSDQRLTTLFAGPSAHPYLLRESAGLVTKILRILGISTAGMDDLGLGGPGLTATTQQLLDVYESFRACIATHPEMAQVCLMSNHLARSCLQTRLLITGSSHVSCPACRCLVVLEVLGCYIILSLSSSHLRSYTVTGGSIAWH